VVKRKGKKEAEEGVRKEKKKNEEEKGRGNVEGARGREGRFSKEG
jgi:hypothetical protein